MYIIPVIIPTPLALVLIFQLLKYSPPTVAGALVPTLFLHQRTAPSQGAVISLYLESVCVCVCLCVCVDGWPVSKSVQCPVVGRLLILDPSIVIRREVLFTTHTEILRENSPQCHTVVVKFSRMETS